MDDTKINLKLLKKVKMSEAFLCMLASEEVLAKTWNTPKEDEAWKDL